MLGSNELIAQARTMLAEAKAPMNANNLNRAMQIIAGQQLGPNDQYSMDLEGTARTSGGSGNRTSPLPQSGRAAGSGTAAQTRSPASRTAPPTGNNDLPLPPPAPPPPPDRSATTTATASGTDTSVLPPMPDNPMLSNTARFRLAVGRDKPNYLRPSGPLPGGDDPNSGTQQLDTLGLENEAPQPALAVPPAATQPLAINDGIPQEEVDRLTELDKPARPVYPLETLATAGVGGARPAISALGAAVRAFRGPPPRIDAATSRSLEPPAPVAAPTAPTPAPRTPTNREATAPLPPRTPTPAQANAPRPPEPPAPAPQPSQLEQLLATAPRPPQPARVPGPEAANAPLPPGMRPPPSMPNPPPRPTPEQASAMVPPAVPTSPARTAALPPRNPTLQEASAPVPPAVPTPAQASASRPPQPAPVASRSVEELTGAAPPPVVAAPPAPTPPPVPAAKPAPRSRTRTVEEIATGTPAKPTITRAPSVVRGSTRAQNKPAPPRDEAAGVEAVSAPTPPPTPPAITSRTSPDTIRQYLRQEQEWLAKQEAKNSNSPTLADVRKRIARYEAQLAKAEK